MRHSFARCEELPSTEPTTTSPTSAGFNPVAATEARSSVASRSSAGVSLRPPLRARVMGVRSAETTTTSSGDLEEIWRPNAKERGRGDGGGGGARVSGKHEAGC
jgi:hypothetical protein